MDLVELYRKVHKHTEAAKILINIAEDLKALNVKFYKIGQSDEFKKSICYRSS